MTALLAAESPTPSPPLSERRALSQRQSLAIVGAAHVVLLGLLSLALRPATPPIAEADAVPVEIVTAAEARGAAPRARPTPPAPPPPAASEPAKPPVEAKAAEPKAEAEPDKPKPEKPKPEPEKHEPPPKPDAADKPAKRLDTDALAKALDRRLPKPKSRPLDTTALAKSLDAAVPAAKSRPLDAAALAKSLDAALPKGPAKAARADPHAAAAIAAAIRAQVTPCWNLPVGAATAGKVTTLLHLDINRDGTVAGRPGLVGQTGVTSANADYARAVAETARRAVLRCAPLKLPADQYDQWRAVEINFDPSNL